MKLLHIVAGMDARLERDLSLLLPDTKKSTACVCTLDAAAPTLEARGVQVEGLAWKRLLNPRPLWRLARLVREGQPNTVHVWGLPALRAFRLALGKWRGAVREAGKQARRARFPEVADLATTTDVAARLGRAALAVVLHEEADVALGSADVPADGDVVLVVGPEGGLTADELGAFADAGATAYRLGPTVLRTSTAGTAALAILFARSGRWRA